MRGTGLPLWANNVIRDCEEASIARTCNVVASENDIYEDNIIFLMLERGILYEPFDFVSVESVCPFCVLTYTIASGGLSPVGS